MGDPAGRMLELLSLFQARRSWSGAELAARLEVTERTVRRDVDRLRLLGYPVEAVPGRYGGYQLGRGGQLPPLLLDDDEAVAVALGLRAAVDGSVAGLEESAISTLAKLDQLLPTRVAARVRALHESTARVVADGEAPPVDSAALVQLAHACFAHERVRFEYVDRARKPSNRLVEPLRLVRSGSRWYLVARDVDRAAWRTFRLDRMQTVECVGTPFTMVDPPDPVELVSQGLRAWAAYPFRARIRLPVGVEDAVRIVPRTIGVFEGEPAGDGTPRTVVELGSTSLERMVGYLAGLHPPCEVLEPPELRERLRAHAAAVVGANAEAGGR